MWINLLSCAQFLCLVCAILVPAAAGQQEFPPHNSETLAQILKSREDAISSLSVHAQWTRRGDSDSAYAKEGRQAVVWEQRGKTARVKCEITKEVPLVGDSGDLANPKTIMTRDVGVYDGLAVKWTNGPLSDDGTPRFISGVISSDRDIMPWEFDPRIALDLFSGTTVSQFITSYDVESIENETGASDSALVVTFSPIQTNLERRGRLWISPDLNYSVVRRQLEVRFPGSEKWILYHQVSCADYTEIQPGVWLPSSCEFKEFAIDSSHAQGEALPDPFRDLSIRFSDWTVNPILDDSIFALDFADGVYVTDKILGQKYQVAGTPAIMIQAQVAESRKLLNERPHRSYWFYLFNGLVLCCIAGVWIVARIRRHRISGR